jgi:ABC-2 type transport system permease protein
MDCVYYAINIAFFKILYRHTGTLAGWSESQTMLFVSVFLLVDALHMTVFTNNLWQMPRMINQGELDAYLIRPVSSLFFLSLREFAANSFLNVLIALGIFVWGLSLNPELATPWRVALLFALVLNGAFLHFLTGFAFVIPTFWTHSGRGLSDSYHILSRFIERPDRLFRGGIRLVLTVALPMSLIASFPARIYLEPEELPRLLAHVVVVTAAFFGALLLLWRRGLRAYSSASS